MAYATTSDLYAMGLPSAALTGVASEAITAALDGASSICDSYLRGSFGTPIATPSAALKLCVCRIAAYTLLCSRGFNPEALDGVARKNYDDAISWLKDCHKGLASPIDYLADATPSVDENAPLMESDTPVW